MTIEEKNKNSVLQYSSDAEKNLREQFFDLFKACPIPDNELLKNLGLFINRQTLSRFLFFNELYKKILDVHGAIFEFGVRWGQNMALFESLRGIYEPYNFTRKIVGFDTFSGFPSIHQKDEKSKTISKGGYSVTSDYRSYLESILDYHEQESPVPHIQKYRLIEGNVIETIDEYLLKNPETIIALAYFDLDLYEPTKKCLQAIQSHLTKGSILGFDELCWEDAPGETQALKEVMDLINVRIRRLPFAPSPSYMVVE